MSFHVDRVKSFKVTEKIIVQDDQGYELCGFDGPFAEIAAIIFINRLKEEQMVSHTTMEITQCP